jgi:uncharacterized protein (DUF736 family)
MQIGEFSRTRDGYTGRVTTIAHDFEMTIVLADSSDAENAPEFRCHLGADGEGPEIGAAWKHEGERAGPFLKVTLDDPSFIQPIRANLFRSSDDDARHHLVWNRSTRRDSGDGKPTERS